VIHGSRLSTWLIRKSLFCTLDLYFLLLIRITHSIKAKKIVLKHIILYVHRVDLLMCSPTKLDFLFYDFSMIYYKFSKIQHK